MNNSKTPKIVVGVGLAAIYATGLAIFMPRGAHDNVVAQNASDAPTAQIAAEPVPLPAIVPESTDTSTSVTEQPAAMEAELRGKEQRIASVATASPTERRDVENSNRSNEGTRADNEPTNSADDVPLSVQAESASSVNDSQITADVKSQMAAVALAGAIDVTTNEGVVELTGSVPNQEVMDKARLAARNVADVRDVDASALKISD